MTETPLPPVTAIERYARKQLSITQFFRSLVSHTGWIAPQMQLQEHLGMKVFPAVELTTPNFVYDPEVLMVFSDRGRLQRALQQSAELGLVAVDVPGWEIFARLTTRTANLFINPGSGGIECFNLERKHLPMARAWGEAVAFERQLEQSSELPFEQLRERFRRAPELIGFLDRRSKALITLPGEQGMRNPAVLFTAPDTMGLFYDILSVEQAAAIEYHYVKGPEWFDQLPLMGIDGVLINPCGGATGFALRLPTP